MVRCRRKAWRFICNGGIDVVEGSHTRGGFSMEFRIRRETRRVQVRETLTGSEARRDTRGRSGWRRDIQKVSKDGVYRIPVDVPEITAGFSSSCSGYDNVKYSRSSGRCLSELRKVWGSILKSPHWAHRDKDTRSDFLLNFYFVIWST